MDHKGKIVAVEDNLSPVKEQLMRKGYQVVGVNNFREAQLVVLRGDNENLLGMQDTLTDAPVITANGKTTEDIVSEVENRFRV